MQDRGGGGFTPQISGCPRGPRGEGYTHSVNRIAGRNGRSVQSGGTVGNLVTAFGEDDLIGLLGIAAQSAMRSKTIIMWFMGRGGYQQYSLGR
jgi:hypothetical protein